MKEDKCELRNNILIRIALWILSLVNENYIPRKNSFSHYKHEMKAFIT